MRAAVNIWVHMCLFHFLQQSLNSELCYLAGCTEISRFHWLLCVAFYNHHRWVWCPHWGQRTQNNQKSFKASGGLLRGPSIKKMEIGRNMFIHDESRRLKKYLLLCDYICISYNKPAKILWNIQVSRICPLHLYKKTMNQLGRVLVAPYTKK